MVTRIEIWKRIILDLLSRYESLRSDELLELIRKKEDFDGYWFPKKDKTYFMKALKELINDKKTVRRIEKSHKNVKYMLTKKAEWLRKFAEMTDNVIRLGNETIKLVEKKPLEEKYIVRLLLEFLSLYVNILGLLAHVKKIKHFEYEVGVSSKVFTLQIANILTSCYELYPEVTGRAIKSTQESLETIGLLWGRDKAKIKS